jgi:hypothetical protein
MGFWLSRDPIEEQGGENIYLFVDNNPISERDVLGLEPYSGPGKCGECSIVYTEGDLSGDGGKTSPAEFDWGKTNYEQCKVCRKFNIDKPVTCSISVTFDPNTDPNQVADGIGITYFQHEWKHVKCESHSFSWMQAMLNIMKDKCCQTGTNIFDAIRQAARLNGKACNNFVDCDDYKKSTDPGTRAKSNKFCQDGAQAEREFIKAEMALKQEMDKWPAKCE